MSIVIVTSGRAQKWDDAAERVLGRRDYDPGKKDRSPGGGEGEDPWYIIKEFYPLPALANRFRYVIALVGDWNDALSDWDEDAKATPINHVLNVREMRNTATLIQGAVAVGGGTGRAMMPIAVGERVRAWRHPDGVMVGNDPVWLMDQPNHFGCAIGSGPVSTVGFFGARYSP